MKKTLFKTTLSQIGLTLLLMVSNSVTNTLSYAQSLPHLGDPGSEDLSPVAERKLGEDIMRGIRQDNDFIDDEMASEYINDFGSRLLDVPHEARGEANFDFFFFSVRDPIINAFALPGGFIAVHSGLILTAENESQLASVLSHEIGHIKQRHIARMLGNQKNDVLIPIASLILAALTMRASPDAAMALALGGQGLAAQRQLDFSQSAEREADRVGLQILRDGGYDPTDMVTFFERMQRSARGYSDNFPAFLRTHPMTSERIADIESRIQSDTFKKHKDSPDFQLFRSRIRVLQDTSMQGLLDTKAYFEIQIKQSITSKKTNSAAYYGLAFTAFQQSQFKDAQDYLNKARKQAKVESSINDDNLFFTSLELDILLRSKQNKEALKHAEVAEQRFPTSRGVSRQYSEALIANKQSEKAITYLRDRTQLYRKDFGLQEQLAKAYAAAGHEALEHLALAESLALTGAISPALDQLGIARRSPDATFYDSAIIDARERDLRERYKEELDALKKQENKNESRYSLTTE